MIKFLKYLLVSLTSLIVLLSILPLFFDKEKIYEDIEKMHNMGLAKGGNLGNAIIVKDDKILNDEGLRNNLEFVKLCPLLEILARLRIYNN